MIQTIASVENFERDCVEQDLCLEIKDDTIVATATPVGFGGVAIVRVSGDKNTVLAIKDKVIKKNLKPRFAYYGEIYASCGEQVLDKGIALYFSGPNSYTGEDVLELHCHGGPIVTDTIMSEIIKLGARIAEPGEFTKRAWLNGKMDLAQVEAVTDLINATSQQAARCAVNTLTGKFSEIINSFLLQLIYLRTYVEAAIDFSDQEIDFIADGEVTTNLEKLTQELSKIISETKQGVLLQEGVKIVIAGNPNVGKSSLLNALCRREEAIVTSIPGTTRDIVKTNLNIKGVPVSLIDTAGIRNTDDIIEQEGIKRSFSNVESADFVLLVIDVNSVDLNQIKTNNFSLEHLLLELESCAGFNGSDYINSFSNYIKNNKNKIIVVFNKIDQTDQTNRSIDVKNLDNSFKLDMVFASAKNNDGISALEEVILHKIGYQQTNEGNFIARRRHLESLKQVEASLQQCKLLIANNYTQDLIAEELRSAQDSLAQITGEYTPDDLLGNIFSSFCIGK